MENQELNNFFELLKPHYNDALRYSRALCSVKYSQEASDILQSSFLKALEGFDKLLDKNKFKSWFFKIITNCFLDTVRGSFWKKYSSIDEFESRDNIPDVFDVVKFSDERNLLDKALDKIKEKEKTALLLFEIGNFSIDEIKVIQNEKSESAIKTRLSRARQKLQNIILELERIDVNLINKRTKDKVVVL